MDMKKSERPIEGKLMRLRAVKPKATAKLRLLMIECEGDEKTVAEVQIAMQKIFGNQGEAAR